VAAMKETARNTHDAAMRPRALRGMNILLSE
jgi:hypothetical protein